ncbi:hypothetical protein SAMN04488133_2024 [Halobellus limi]|uniref:Uncharacterized protein n=1 Tax=Halobellus limi TaxID=699433 RepID=A0A1H5ZJG3_9EURY|nr:hypothetical protein SAMN04488133_2024 [Halobellus limi]
MVLFALLIRLHRFPATHTVFSRHNLPSRLRHPRAERKSDKQQLKITDYNYLR